MSKSVYLSDIFKHFLNAIPIVHLSEREEKAGCHEFVDFCQYFQMFMKILLCNMSIVWYLCWEICV